MKPFFRFFLILILCGALLLPVWAVPSDLTLSDGEAAAGEVVYLTLTLNKETPGNTMGVEYSYDTKHLEAIPEFCSWSKGGSIKDFDLKGRGVWATAMDTTLEGNICTLAFRIKQDADFSETTVSCSLFISSDTEQTGKFEASAKVRLVCNHSFTDWTEDGTSLHSRSCQNCGISQTQVHKWDQGVTQTDPNSKDKTIRVFTCTVCGAKRQEDVAGTAPETGRPTEPTVPTEAPTTPTEPDRPQPTEPDRPQPTEPDRPQPTEPSRPQPTEPDRPQPTEPSRPQPTEPTHSTNPPATQPQSPGQSQQDHSAIPTQPAQSGQHHPDDGHDHTQEVIYDSNGNILAIRDPDYQGETDDIHSVDDGHDHSGEQNLITNTQPKTETTLAVIALAIVGVGAAIFFVKKKKH